MAGGKGSGKVGQEDRKRRSERNSFQPPPAKQERSHYSLVTETGVGAFNKVVKVSYHGDLFQSLSEVKNRIEDEAGESFKDVEGNKIDMHPAFVKALKFIIHQLEKEIRKPWDAVNRKHVLVFHGVPLIGKTTLATALTHYLATLYKEVSRIEFVKYLEGDYDQNAKKTKDIANVAKFLILDQLNPDHFHMTTLINSLSGDLPPIIVFTSGHYWPGPHLVELPRVQINFIHISVTCEDMKKRFKHIPDDMIKEVLANTDNFGHVLEILQFYRMPSDAGPSRQVAADLLQMVWTINLENQINTSQIKQCVHLLWSSSLENLAELKGSQSLYTLSQKQLLALQGFFWPEKDISDRGFSGFLNWLAPEGTPFEELEGFKVYRLDEVDFVFTCRPMIDSLLCQYKTDKKAVYETILELFNEMETNHTKQRQCLKGLLLEELVRLYCQLQRKGMIPSTDNIVPIDVHRLCEAYDVKSLVENLILDQKELVWFNLDVVGHQCFPGYDFAEFHGHVNKETGEYELRDVWLFQVTVNPGSKNARQKEIMYEKYHEIKKALIDHNSINTDHLSVYPVFVVDHAYQATVDVEITVKPQTGDNAPGVDVPIKKLFKFQTLNP